MDNKLIVLVLVFFQDYKVRLTLFLLRVPNDWIDRMVHMSEDEFGVGKARQDCMLSGFHSAADISGSQGNKNGTKSCPRRTEHGRGTNVRFKILNPLTQNSLQIYK